MYLTTQPWLPRKNGVHQLHESCSIIRQAERLYLFDLFLYSQSFLFLV
jgi:hypothetical protein